MLENILPFNIFPEGSLANSIIVTVWVGVLVIAFFNLRFGWVLSGLVVPGYLVPLLLVNPVSVVVIILEAWITYSLSLFICNKSGSWLNLSHFFGRDRFFLLVIISVFVRLVMDAYAFPYATAWVQDQWQLELSFQNDLHSFGLIIISLMANQMWKTGFFRGSLHLFITIGITFLIVKYLVMGLTNFSIANLSFMYEEIASAILASPKSYIILLICCFIASRMNLLYGWEYSGILIPSLIALQWYFPQKVLVTFIETFVILGLATLLLKIPRIANMDIAGGRKLVVFFTIGFIYKMALAYFIEWYDPYYKVSDYFAFGYLLSTLLAIKIHDKNLLFHTTRATVQTSLVAVFIATIIGFGLTKLPTDTFSTASDSQVSASIKDIEGNFDEWMLEQKVDLFEAKSQGFQRQPSITEIDLFVQAITEIDGAIKSQNAIDIETQAKLNSLGYAIFNLDSYLLLQPIEHKSWGIYAFNKKPQDTPLLIASPRGLDEELAYDASYSIYKLLNAKYLAISTSPFKSNDDGSSDYLVNPNTLFSYFQKTLSNNGVLQVRTTKRSSEIVAKRLSRLIKTNVNSYLWIKGNLPRNLNLNLLSEITQKPEIIWGQPDFFNQQRNASSNGFLELLINQNIANRLKVLASNESNQVTELEREVSIEGYLNALILEEKSYIAPKFSELYQAPKSYESLFFYQEILLPLLELVDNPQFLAKAEEGQETLQNINKIAGIFNYNITLYTYSRNQKKYLILSEQDGPNKRFWGTYVFALNNQSKEIIEVPRPIMELGTFEYGLFLFNKLNSKALLIAGAHPNANKNGKSNIISRYNTNSIFNIVHYALFDRYQNQLMQAHQIRGMGYEIAALRPELELIISEESNFDKLPAENNSLMSAVKFGKELNLNFVHGDDDEVAAGLALGSNSISNQLRYQKYKKLITHWVSPSLNTQLKQKEEQWLNNKHFLALGWANELVDIISYLSRTEYSFKPIKQSVVNDIDNFISSENLAYLLRAIKASQYTFNVVTDIDTRQSFLLISDAEALVAVRNLNSISNDDTLSTSTAFIDLYITNRHRWLFAKEPI